MTEGPRTARAEMAGRIEVLLRQAANEREDAARLRANAEDLDDSASLRESIASEYQAIMEKVDRRG